MATHQLEHTPGSTNPPKWSKKTGLLWMCVKGIGAPIPTGLSSVPIIVPFDCVIVAAVFEGGEGESGSSVFDIWKAADGSTIPTNSDSITASAPITNASGRYTRDTTLTGWSPNLTNGQRLWLNCDSNGGGFTNAIISLEVVKS